MLWITFVFFSFLSCSSFDWTKGAQMMTDLFSHSIKWAQLKLGSIVAQIPMVRRHVSKIIIWSRARERERELVSGCLSELVTLREINYKRTTSIYEQQPGWSSNWLAGWLPRWIGTSCSIGCCPSQWHGIAKLAGYRWGCSTLVFDL